MLQIPRTDHQICRKLSLCAKFSEKAHKNCTNSPDVFVEYTTGPKTSLSLIVNLLQY